MHFPPVGLPVLLFLACAGGLAVVLLIIPQITNPTKPGRVTLMPYESGMDPIHDTRRRFDVRFHIQAIAFLVFDVELLFLYPWAAAARPIHALAAQSLAGSGDVARAGIDPAIAAPWLANPDAVFLGVMIFFALLALGYVYDWKKGVFQWR